MSRATRGSGHAAAGQGPRGPAVIGRRRDGTPRQPADEAAPMDDAGAAVPADRRSHCRSRCRSEPGAAERRREPGDGLARLGFEPADDDETRSRRAARTARHQGFPFAKVLVAAAVVLAGVVIAALLLREGVTTRSAGRGRRGRRRHRWKPVGRARRPTADAEQDSVEEADAKPTPTKKPPNPQAALVQSCARWPRRCAQTQQGGRSKAPREAATRPGPGRGGAGPRRHRVRGRKHF